MHFTFLQIVLESIRHHRGWYLNMGSIVLGTVSSITANQVSLFFTVGVATTAMIYNIVRTRIMLRKEKERLENHDDDLPQEDDDD